MKAVRYRPSRRLDSLFMVIIRVDCRYESRNFALKEKALYLNSSDLFVWCTRRLNHRCFRHVLEGEVT